MVNAPFFVRILRSFPASNIKSALHGNYSSLCSLSLRSLRTLRFNHSNATGIDIISCYASKLTAETGSPARPTIIVEKLTVKLDAEQLIKSGSIGINITHSQDTARCRFPKINRAIVTSLDRRRRLFWGRERLVPCPELRSFRSNRN